MTAPTAQELIELKGVEPELAARLVRELTSAGYLVPPAVEPFQGELPEEGDRIRVVRTSRKIYEGFWKPCDPETDGLSSTGHSAIVVEVDGVWMRLRDQGETQYADSTNGYAEADVIEVLERRGGEPYEHLLGDWREVHYPTPPKQPRRPLLERLGLRKP